MLTIISHPIYNALRHGLLLLISSLSLLGCAAESPKTVPAPIEGYSHTSAAINWFTVNGGGGPNVSPNLGGGKQTCCALLPVKWQPGLKVVVEWEKDPNPKASRNWSEPRYSDAWFKAAERHRTGYTHHRTVVEVPAYDRIGVINVHFLPCNQVKVSASIYGYGHPQYAIKEPLNMEEPTTCPHS